MSSVFRKDDKYVDKPKRNVFDLSFQNNLTLKMGEIVPVMCQEVLPGDSFKIDPTFGLRYMPQAFPVQTRQRASIKFYYVRNRNLWKDWMDFIGKTKSDLVTPYINFSGDEHRYFLKPSSMADYMGVPIKIDVPYGSLKEFKLHTPTASQGYVSPTADFDYAYVPNSGIVFTNSVNEPMAITTHKNVQTEFYAPSAVAGVANFVLSDIYGGVIGVSDSMIPAPTLAKVQGPGTQTLYTKSNFCLLRKAWRFKGPISLSVEAPNYNKVYLILRTTSGKDVAVSMQSDGSEFFYDNVSIRPEIEFYHYTGTWERIKETVEYIVGLVGVTNAVNVSPITTYFFNVKTVVTSNDDLCWCDVALSELPFASDDNPNGIRLSSLPFRAIRSIYNALIRNAENNPLIVNGQPEYNKYVENVDGGAQSGWKLLEKYYSNWSDDRFTTALPSPQQGNAPLVGLTGVNGATVVLGNADGSQTVVNLQVDAETGNIVMVDGVSGSSDNPTLTHAFMSAADYGMTINDLRNVNSLQRWLENNIRRGYKYKDQLMAHYGVNARFDVLDMPEFIGGVARDVNVEQITQTVKNEYGELGEYGGNSYIMGSGKSIEHYCDEHGFIIGLMELKPMPMYQDSLPKYLVKSDAFDYYFPEFGKIGMQPITNKEVSFSQSVIADDVDGTFGYQRAWYDYLENLDQVHGAFRFDKRGFLIARDFASMPKLNKDFLTVNSDDFNNTFYSDDDEDKILGQVYFNISAKRPIPLIGIPALE